MSRLFTAVVFVGMVTLLVPDLRERAQPHVQELATWTWGWVEGPLAPALNPFRRVKAQTEMGEIGRRLVNQRNRGQPAPDPAQFTEYIVRNRILANPDDPWGTPYRIEQQADSLALMSAGPDREYDTDDDVVFKIRYPPRQPARPRFHFQ